MVIGALFVTLILFLPTQKIDPGFGNNNSEDYVKLYKKVQKMEKDMEGRLYISKVQTPDEW